MTVAIDVTPMNLDRDTSSAKSDSGRSDTVKSETSQPSSIDEPDFPSSPLQKHTSVLPFAKYCKPEHDGVYQLQETVATTLFNTSPDTLISFVNPMIGTFKAVFKGEKQLVIWRKGNAGFIGIYESHTSMKMFGFEHLVGFSIGWDGSWQIIIGAGNAFCESKWPVVWSGPYKSLGGVYEMVVDRESMEQAKGERAAKLAAEMLQRKFWNAMVDMRAI